MSIEINMGELLPVFLTEADEQIAVLDNALLHLEREGGDPEFVREIFRAAHTLKGSSAAMGFTNLSSLTHAMETVFDAVRQGSLVVTEETVDLLLAALDAIKEMREAIGEKGADTVGTPTGDLVRTLNEIAAGGGGNSGTSQAPAPSGPQAEAPAEADASEPGKVWHIGVRFVEACEMPAVRAFMVLNELAGLGTIVSSAPPMEEIQEGKAGRDLTVVLRSEAIPEELRRAATGVSEVESATVTGSAPAVEPAAAAASPAQDAPRPAAAAASAAEGIKVVEIPRAPSADAGRGSAASKTNTQTVRVSVDKLDKLMNLVGELVIDRTRVSRIAGILDEQAGDGATKDLIETSLHLGRVIGEVQEEVMKARMLPIDQVFMRFPRMVRDLARKAGKEIDFQVEGGETELDRSVIEAIVDPLTHLLRNSVDHGIEPPDRREQLGKPRTGSVVIRARHEENQIVVDILDDGKGIDYEGVRDKAVSKGLISAEAAAAMSPREALQLIFLSGLSTAEKVTDVSGRGVGMDIVNSNIQRLGGSVDLQTTVGQGTRFTVRLPLTLAIIRGLLIRHHEDTYVVPLGSVAEALRVSADQIQRIRGREVLHHRGSVLPLVTLTQVFELGMAPARRDHSFVVVARYGQSRIGIIVDELVGEQEIVIKPLDSLTGTGRGLAGASILGNGQVALILDVPAFAAEAGDNLGAGSAALAA